jgi:hypothetical protein
MRLIGTSRSSAVAPDGGGSGAGVGCVVALIVSL